MKSTVPTIVLEALAFYADEKRYREFADDEAAAVYGRNTGSEFGDDKGEIAREALAALDASHA